MKPKLTGKPPYDPTRDLEKVSDAGCCGEVRNIIQSVIDAHQKELEELKVALVYSDGPRVAALQRSGAIDTLVKLHKMFEL